MKKYEIIKELSEIKKRKSGWTYILISKDKKYMKIGKTTSELGRRIKNINSDRNYKEYNFSFFMAVNSYKLELLFLTYFSQYRACYRWNDGKNSFTGLNQKDLRGKARKKANEIYSSPSCQEINKILYEYSQITRLELFKIPPRKIASKLDSIINSLIDNLK